MVPMMSKTPIRASRPALVEAGIPWSCAAGMKWVPISPLVDQPQIQKVPNEDPERPAAGVLAAGVEGDRRAALRRRRRRVCGVGPGVRRTPSCRCRPGGRAAATARRERAAAAKTCDRPAAQRQPGPSARLRDRRQEDQLPGRARRREDADHDAAVPARTSGWRRPRRTPAPARPCRCRPRSPTAATAATGWSSPGSAREPTATSASDAATTWRTPKRSISAAANGAVRP